MTNWRNCAPSFIGGGKTTTNYDVMISVPNWDKKSAKEGWQKKSLSFMFRNKAYERIRDHNAAYLRISEIQPNASRIYFDFMPDEYRSKTLGRKLSRKSGTNGYYRTVFPFLSKNEYEIINGYWIGEYTLLYDADCSHYYIENESVRGWRR